MSASADSLSETSRFRFVEEFIEAGESGRDNGDMPFTCCCCTMATAGEAMAKWGVMLV
jgi:hypothetical protein